MANANSTLSNDTLTKHQKAEKYPQNKNSFSIWFCEEGDVFVVNDKNGKTFGELSSYENAAMTANVLKTACEAGIDSSRAVNLPQTNVQSQPTVEQMKIAFGEIADMASVLNLLCYEVIADGDMSGCKVEAAGFIASRIGWVADRCIGFSHKTSDSWLLPPVWKHEESEVCHA